MGNDLAMQVLGGAGYTREHLPEQLYRDQRLNPIHEGTEAIHGLDLLGRKVTMASGAAYQLFRKAVDATLQEARSAEALQTLVQSFAGPLERLDAVTAQLVALQQNDPDRALANATVYLDAFGRIVAAWLWLKQAIAAGRGLASGRTSDQDFYRGKLQAAHYYCQWELPATLQQLSLLASVDTAPFDMQEAWF